MKRLLVILVAVVLLVTLLGACRAQYGACNPQTDPFCCADGYRPNGGLLCAP